MRERLPSLVIVGRPNVGKSTLFNRITGTRRSIVTNEPGITRDRIYGKAEWRGKAIEIVDTGGIIPDDKALIGTPVPSGGDCPSICSGARVVLIFIPPVVLATSSIRGLHASLSAALFSLRQLVISSVLGMNAAQSRSTSGVHARRCSAVPCEKEGPDAMVAHSKANETRHAEGIGGIHLLWFFRFIREMLPQSRTSSSWQTGIHSCRNSRL